MSTRKNSKEVLREFLSEDNYLIHSNKINVKGLAQAIYDEIKGGGECQKE